MSTAVTITELETLLGIPAEAKPAARKAKRWRFLAAHEITPIAGKRGLYPRRKVELALNGN